MTADMAYREDALAFAKFEGMFCGRMVNGSIPMPWLLTFLRGSNAEQVVREIFAGLTADDIGPFGRITYYPLQTGAFRTPLVQLPDESVVFPFNLIRIPSSNDLVATEADGRAKPRVLRSHSQSWRIAIPGRRL